MAAFQESYKWMTLFLLVLASTLMRWVTSCDSKSKELHICLNIYLERDFPLIETIIDGQKKSGYGGRRIILENNDLDNICNQISSLYDCYWTVFPECDTIWKTDRFLRVMDVMNATQNHLCGGYKNNLKDLIMTSGCFLRSRPQTSNCSGFHWMMTWRHVLRMQMSPESTCLELQSYWDCLKNRMSGVTCGPHTTEVYQKLIEVWLRHWCGKDLTAEEERKFFYKVAYNMGESLARAREELDKRSKQLNDDLSQDV